MHFFIKILLSVMKGGSLVHKGAHKAMDFIKRPISFIIRKTGRFVLLPVYKFGWAMKRRIQGFFSPTRNTLFFLLTKRYVVHLLIVSLTLFVYVGNISAQEVREENYGQDTVMFALYNEPSDITLVTDKTIPANVPLSMSYQDQQALIQQDVLVEDWQDLVAEQLAEGIATTTDGGATLVKPNVADLTLPPGTNAPRLKVVDHVVEEGETLSVIAQEYNISVNTILWANQLTAKSVIKPGMSLRILPMTGVEYKVKKGDTLQSIARKYKLDVDKIVATNTLPEDTGLSVGQQLLLPDAEQLVTVVAKKPAAVGKPRETSTDISGVIKPPSVSGTSDMTEGKGGMVWPTDWHVITQYYGFRHTGVDLDGDYSSHIYAAEAGVIDTIGWNNGGYGNRIIIDHGNGVKTLYAHMQTFSVKKGQYVEKGQMLGMMGSTGRSTGTHLHFEVRVNGAFRNPLQYVR